MDLFSVPYFSSDARGGVVESIPTTDNISHTTPIYDDSTDKSITLFGHKIATAVSKETGLLHCDLQTFPENVNMFGQ